MPAPLPPYQLKSTPRLSFLKSPKVAVPPGSGGRPTEHWIIQLEAKFDPIFGEGEWRYIRYPQDVQFTDWEVYERFCRKHLPVPADDFVWLMDYLHNFQVLNIDLRTGEVYPVIPRPTGYDVRVPIAAGAGKWISGKG